MLFLNVVAGPPRQELGVYQGFKTGIHFFLSEPIFLAFGPTRVNPSAASWLAHFLLWTSVSRVKRGRGP
jgi:hypothetical protein